MRLAVEVTTCTSARTGIGYYTEHLVDALLETRAPGDELLLLSNRAPAPELAARWAPHLHVEGLPLRALWMQADVPRLLSRVGADVAAFPNYGVALASPCPTIVFVHDLALLRMPELFTMRKSLVMRPLLRQSVASASAIATVSEASRRDIVDLLGVDPRRITLLPGAPHPSCAPAPAAEVAAVRARHGLGRPYLLTVGTLEPRKNLPTLLAAFDRLGGEARGAAATADRDLVVVGGRGWRDRELMRELGARQPLGHVRWLGYVSERELVALYTGAELFVYPSRLEGFGLPVVEAMACGTPVVASDVPALREVAGDDGGAVFVPPGDAPALAQAMTGLLADPAAAARARAAGPARARAFSWSHTARQLWQLARDTGPTRIRRPADAARPAPGMVPASPVGPAPRPLRERDWSLVATVAYADLFDAPLPVGEATRSCIGAALDETDLHRAMKSSPALAPALVTQPPSGFLVMAGREHLVARRQEGATAAHALVGRHRRTLDLLATLPFVRMLAFSGATAHHNPGLKADIDLFVVTAGGRAYTAYSLLFLATKLTRTRRIVCPNYLVDENELRIAYHHDVFTAHQVISARPVSGEETYRAFCHANEDWVRPLFPGFQPRPPAAELGGEALGRPPLQQAAERVLAPVAAPLERLLRWGWRAQLRRRAAGAARPDVVLSDGILKLHMSDYRRRVLERFRLRLDDLRAEIAGRVARAAAGGTAPGAVRAGRS